ncbi:MAG TPA: hypothetical protein VKH18_07285 [Terriglobales bacterium]|nr:hypothetical protein [Terriglobales bacterium]
MKFSLAVAVVLAGISVSGLAQQNNALKVKHSAPEKAPRSVPMPTPKAGGATTASAANAKNLQAVEHQTAQTSAPSRSAGKKTPGTASLKPVKDKPTPPINFNGTSSSKSAGTTNQAANPYKGRLKQKHAHQ